eukprot:scaffold2311_cov107-Cylindrotheca_fusiformis.AAC.4
MRSSPMLPKSTTSDKSSERFGCFPCRLYRTCARLNAVKLVSSILLLIYSEIVVELKSGAFFLGRLAELLLLTCTWLLNVLHYQDSTVVRMPCIGDEFSKWTLLAFQHCRQSSSIFKITSKPVHKDGNQERKKL